ncbi:L,D-transpeptidase family protein [Methylosoma difficile]
MKNHIIIASLFLFLANGGNALATTYNLPPNPGDSVVEQFPSDEQATIEVAHSQTLLDVARDYLLGQMEVVRINPNVDRWLVKPGQSVRLPNKRVLPDAPHDGIVLNISEYRMFYYPRNNPGKVISFAHGVGRQDWKTPLGKTSVARKVKDPAWHPPESIRREHAANGDPLPEIVPPGPHNPLGAYALYLNLPGEYRIHGTDIDKIYGIGMQITHGCVRMYPEDIQALYGQVDVGTPVYLIKQPVKVGWLDNVLYIEAHPDLEGDEMSQQQRYAIALSLIQKATKEDFPDFDQEALNKALTELTGDPIALYERLPPLEGATVEPAPMPVALPKPAPKPKVLPVVAKPTKKLPVVAAKPEPKQAKKAAKTNVVAVNKSAKKPDAKAAKKKPTVVAVKETKKQDKKANKKTASTGGYYRGT